MKLSYHKLVLALLPLAACGGDDGMNPGRLSDGAGRSIALAATTDLSAPARVTVYKPAFCGCCAGWVEHLRSTGFEVDVEETDELELVKSRLGVPSELESCHTAEVGGYVIEGHVPADVIARLLAEQPEVRGIAVPGMPIGSPGMEGMAGEAEPFDIISFDEMGQTSVYETR